MQPQATRSLAAGDGLRVISLPPSVGPLTEALADALGMSHRALSERLALDPCVLPLPSGPEAVRARRFLAVLGVQLADDGGASDSVIDLRIHPKDGADPKALAEVLAPILRMECGRDAQDLAGELAAPEGLAIDGLSPALADRLMRRLRRVAQAVLMQSERMTALHDVFATGQDVVGLANHLRILGHSEDPLTGALASGLDGKVARHLSQRFPQARVLNRDFQRYDVMLARVAGSLCDDYADFLTARTGLRRDRLGKVTPQTPIRLDAALPRANALRFLADYRAIGLQTYLRLL